MQPRSNRSPSCAWTAFSRPTRRRICGRTLVPDGGRCRTTKIVAPRFSGRCRTTSRRASTPPAEAPTTTLSRPVRSVAPSKGSPHARPPHDRTDPPVTAAADGAPRVTQSAARVPQEREFTPRPMSFALEAGHFCNPRDQGGDHMAADTPRRRWLALYVLTLGSLMIVLDATIVNVALPSIRADLGFSETELAWVVNAYLLTFGGFLLLGGRLGDLYGQRKLFVFGITLFTVASLACGIATTQGFLVAARAIQGIGGAIASAVALSLMMTRFTEPADRAKAMGVFGFVAAGGGTIGVVLGGVLTDSLNWHWIFLVNVPIGVVVCALCLRLLPPAPGMAGTGRLDIGGAVTVTASLMVATYAIVNGNQEGWTSAQTLGLLAAAAVLLGVFLTIESRVRAPLMPLRLFRQRNIATANAVGVLWAAAMFAWFFLSALYLQLVLGYTPLEVGLGFLPATLIMGGFSLSLAAKLEMRFGI